MTIFQRFMRPDWYCRGLGMLLASSMSIPVMAQTEGDQWTGNLYFENDLFANTDLNYTNGVRASLVSPDLLDFKDEAGKLDFFIDDLNALFSFLHPTPSAGDQPLLNMVASVGQLMFTPRDKERTTLDPDDRPYAGWLYLGLGYNARTDRVLNSVELDIGVVGPAALAKQTQDLVHEIRDIDKFKGWDNQLNNELGIQMVFEQKRRNFTLDVAADGRWGIDFISHWGASLGNVATYANAGGEVRFGYKLPEDFGTSTLHPGGDNTTPGRGDINIRPLQAHAFLAADGRFVAHNIFLDGNTFRDSHSVDKEPWVADVLAGIVVAYKRWHFSYSHVYRTREFVGQDEPQEFGSLSLSYTWPWM